MADGQIRKNIVNRARKKPSLPAKAESGDPLDDPFSKESTDAGAATDPNYRAKAIKAAAISNSPDRGDQSVFEQPSTMRRDFFDKMKGLSGRGKLTPEMYGQAKENLAKYEGVSDEAFDSTMSKNLIRPSDFATAAPTESKGEAAQNVMFQNQYGTGLGALAAMQDPNYELGSGSSLNQPARAIGPASGKFRRASRRLRRQGYGAAAQQMAMAGEQTRMGEPPIDTPALRGQQMSQKIVAGKEAQKQDIIMSETEKRNKEMEERLKKLSQPRYLGITEQRSSA
jgi:hypothetical protein